MVPAVISTSRRLSPHPSGYLHIPAAISTSQRLNNRRNVLQTGPSVINRRRAVQEAPHPPMQTPGERARLPRHSAPPIQREIQTSRSLKLQPTHKVKPRSKRAREAATASSSSAPSGPASPPGLLVENVNEDTENLECIAEQGDHAPLGYTRSQAQGQGWQQAQDHQAVWQTVQAQSRA